jgi:hypothetical protein
LAGLGIGALPESAVLPEHFILSEKDGFPPLPDVEVVVKSGLSRFNDAARVLAKYLAAGLQPGLSDSASIVL